MKRARVYGKNVRTVRVTVRPVRARLPAASAAHDETTYDRHIAALLSRVQRLRVVVRMEPDKALVRLAVADLAAIGDAILAARHERRAWMAERLAAVKTVALAPRLRG